MYTLEEIERTETTITAKMIPMKERRYVNKDDHLVIKYYDDRTENDDLTNKRG